MQLKYAFVSSKSVFSRLLSKQTEIKLFFFLIKVLNEYFHNVCELDLVFNFYKVRASQHIIAF